MVTRQQYSAPGKLYLAPASGTPGTEDYQEPLFKIRDFPDRKEDVTCHNGETFSVHLQGRWQDIYADYSGETPIIRRANGLPVVLSRQIQARLKLS